MTQSQLSRKLRLHQKWLRHEEGGERFDLRGQRILQLSFASADLRKANLRDAHLSDCVLTHTNLRGADLRDARLPWCNLSCANLQYAHLEGADLEGADLKDAQFQHAYLKGIHDLQDTHLHRTDFDGAHDVPELPMSCPAEGDFIAWAPAAESRRMRDPYVVKLLIPKSAKRSSATSRVCRCDKAKVLKIYPVIARRECEHERVYGWRNEYILGRTVRSEAFDENRWHVYGDGILFFLNRCDAVQSACERTGTVVPV